MESFAEYILNENNYLRKIEIAYYLHKKTNIFFDKSVICKAELARRFVETMDLDVDENLIITACLLYASNKTMDPTNFEKFKRDVQVEDLYYFLRKVMEKQGWKVRLGDNMLNAYSAIRPLSGDEIEYLKIRLIYPEKFWKVANSYYHSNKAWISAKSIEKLDMAIRQTEEKKRFLEEIFSFHL